MAEYAGLFYLAAVNLAGFFLMGWTNGRQSTKDGGYQKKLCLGWRLLAGALGLGQGCMHSAIRPGIGALQWGSH